MHPYLVTAKSHLWSQNVCLKWYSYRVDLKQDVAEPAAAGNYRIALLTNVQPFSVFDSNTEISTVEG